MYSKKPSLRNLLRVLLVTGVVLLLAACVAAPAATEGGQAATSTDEPVEVLWWYAQGGETGELLVKFAEDFSALDNGITVNAEYQGNYTEHLDKLIASAAAGSLPDMIQIGDGQYTPLALNDILLPLDDLINGPNGIDLDTFAQPIYRGIQNDKMYQLAYGVSTPIFYYNVEALEAAGLEGAPETWDEFFDVYLPALAEANPDMVPFAYSTGSWWQQSPVWSSGVMVNDVENFEIDMANPAVIDWFTKMQKARQDDLVYVPTTPTAA